MNKKSAALVASLAMLLGACSSTPMAPPPPAEKAAMVTTPSAAAYAPAPAASPQATAAMSAVATITLPPYLDPQSRISTARSVYFDFDDTTIKGDYTPVVELQGKFLASSPKVAVRIEGNTDERGGAEYNLALGQKRAEAVLKALKIYGARDGQMEAVSWGDSKPKAAGHDETAFAQNRRADLQYPSK